MKLEENLTPLFVVAVALVGPDGQILMQQRHLQAAHGGLWEFPGGKIEAGESPEIAAVRELQEELGVRIAKAALQPVGFASGVTATVGEGGREPVKPLVILLYAAHAWDGVPEAREASAIGWYPSCELADLAMPPLDYPLAQALCRYLNSHSVQDEAI